jgi:hypothetical protein
MFLHASHIPWAWEGGPGVGRGASFLSLLSVGDVEAYRHGWACLHGCVCLLSTHAGTWPALLAFFVAATVASAPLATHTISRLPVAFLPPGCHFVAASQPCCSSCTQHLFWAVRRRSRLCLCCCTRCADRWGVPACWGLGAGLLYPVQNQLLIATCYTLQCGLLKYLPCRPIARVVGAPALPACRLPGLHSRLQGCAASNPGL